MASVFWILGEASAKIVPKLFAFDVVSSGDPASLKNRKKEKINYEMRRKNDVNFRTNWFYGNETEKSAVVKTSIYSPVVFFFLNKEA